MEPERILNSNSVMGDLCTLIGYTWAEGKNNNIFDSEKLNKLINYFFKKYKNEFKESNLIKYLPKNIKEEYLNNNYE